MKRSAKKNFPVGHAHRILEAGPVTLVSSSWKGKINVMTMTWQTVMEFTPSLVGCVISDLNYSFDLIRKSGDCVINIPTAEMINTVIGIGNCSGKTVDKFKKFKLTPVPAKTVGAPLIQECFASFECKVVDRRMIKPYCFFVFEIVKAHVAPTPKYPKTLHYHGMGVFAIDGEIVNRKRQFTKFKGLETF